MAPYKEVINCIEGVMNVEKDCEHMENIKEALWQAGYITQESGNKILIGWVETV